MYACKQSPSFIKKIQTHYYYATFYQSVAVPKCFVFHIVYAHIHLLLLEYQIKRITISFLFFLDPVNCIFWHWGVVARSCPNANQ